MPDRPDVLHLTKDVASEVVDVLCEAFFDYPVMRYVLGAEAGGYAERLATLMGFFVGARVLRGEVMLGVGGPGGLDGAAVMSRPSLPGE